MGVAMNTVGGDTSLTKFSPASAPSSKSRSTIVQLYGVDTHALTAAERDDQIIGFAHGQPLERLATFQWSSETKYLCRRRPSPRRRRTGALLAAAALAHRAGHNPKRRATACRPVPASDVPPVGFEPTLGGF